ncbi:MAG: rRNA pseudouridine synthase [Treponema sp.]|nr:rRNA pseudouridine synthase [Treponema sp.]
MSAEKVKTERLDEILVSQGYSTHRSTRRLLQSRMVTVNGRRITDGSFAFDRHSDCLCIDGKSVATPPHLYLMMNKSQGTVCTHAKGTHESVFASLPEEFQKPEHLPPLHSVGRLDFDTEGLLLLTTDGKLSHRITSPLTHSTKTYFVCLKNECDETERKEYTERFAEGFDIERFRNERSFHSAPAELEWTDEANLYCSIYAKDMHLPALCLLTLTEGKFHQVKRMFWALGNEVVYLKRIAIGKLFLDPALTPGEWRALSLSEETLL